MSVCVCVFVPDIHELIRCLCHPVPMRIPNVCWVFFLDIKIHQVLYCSHLSRYMLICLECGIHKSTNTLHALSKSLYLPGVHVHHQSAQCLRALRHPSNDCVCLCRFKELNLQVKKTVCMLLPDLHTSPLGHQRILHVSPVDSCSHRWSHLLASEDPRNVIQTIVSLEALPGRDGATGARKRSDGTPSSQTGECATLRSSA